jgi:hypothetical protein
VRQLPTPGELTVFENDRVIFRLPANQDETPRLRTRSLTNCAHTHWFNQLASRRKICIFTIGKVGPAKGVLP